jgi:hypothetical protein
MFNLNFFKQKSPQQRFLFILGVTMILIFLTLAIIVMFFGDALNLDPAKFPLKYRIAFGVLLSFMLGSDSAGFIKVTRID